MPVQVAALRPLYKRIILIMGVFLLGFVTFIIYDHLFASISVGYLLDAPPIIARLIVGVPRFIALGTGLGVGLAMVMPMERG
jgi:hypothetical protein